MTPNHFTSHRVWEYDFLFCCAAEERSLVFEEINCFKANVADIIYVSKISM